MQSLVSGVISGFHSTLPASKSSAVAERIPRASDACRLSEIPNTASFKRDLMQLREDVLGQHAALADSRPVCSVTPKPKLSVADQEAREPAMDAFRNVRSIPPLYAHAHFAK
jgi:hypothetical protein